MSLWDLCVDGEWDLALVRAALEMEDVDVNKRSVDLDLVDVGGCR